MANDYGQHGHIHNASICFLFVCNTTLLMLHLPSSLGPEIRACSSKLQRYLCMLLPTPKDKFFLNILTQKTLNIECIELKVFF